MENNIPKFTTIRFTTKEGENVVAFKEDGNIILKGDVNGTRQVTKEELLKMLVKTSPKLERVPPQDAFVRSGKAKRDKEIMRTLLYSNPLINPFGYIPTPNGSFEPTIKNPMIEGLLNGLYGREV